MIAGFKRLF